MASHQKFVRSLIEAYDRLDSGFQHPEQIGRYQIRKHLREGLFYRFYLAFDFELQRQLTVQVPKFEQDRDYYGIDLIKSQARLLAQLEADNIARVYQVGQDNRFPIFVAMPHFPNGTLRDQIEDPHLKLQFHDSAEIISTVAGALHKPHQASIFHHNLTTLNILFDAREEPQLVGFTLAGADFQQLLFHHVYSTELFHLAPEQISDDTTEANSQTDIWALGVILYELLTGERPFEHPIVTGLLRQIQEVNPAPPKTIDKTIPPQLSKAVMKCLRKDPANRYSAVLELSHDLQRWLRRRRR